MKPLAEFIIALTDYARVEGRRCRRAAMSVAIAVALAIVAAALVLVGLVTLVLSLYTALALTMPEPAALLVSGLVAFVLGGVALWMIKLQMR